MRLCFAAALWIPVRKSEEFLAEDDNLLKQEYSILAVDVGRLHHENIVEQELTKVSHIVAPPVLHSLLQHLYHLRTM